MDKNLTYKFNERDLHEILKFIRDYHLDPTKGQRGRTNQGKRGFGGELDEWMPGKLIEIAVCKILERQSTSKLLRPDLKIYSNKEVGERSDPDITEVIDSNKESRKPRIFVEIKRLDLKASWLGPRKHQLKDMTEGYMVHATINFSDDKDIKQQDITASVLKEVVNSDKFDLYNFSNFSDLQAEIKYIYSFQDLRKYGHNFPKGYIMPETEFSRSVKAYKKDSSLGKGFEFIKEYDPEESVIIEMKWEDKEDILSFNEWIVSGKFQILIKNKKKYIYAIKSVEMFNEVFGMYKLDNHTTYKFFFINKLGGDTKKNVDEFLFSKRRLDELIEGKKLPENLKCIKKITYNI